MAAPVGRWNGIRTRAATESVDQGPAPTSSPPAPRGPEGTPARDRRPRPGRGPHGFPGVRFTRPGPGRLAVGFGHEFHLPTDPRHPQGTKGTPQQITYPLN
jgi:hypothetical protein